MHSRGSPGHDLKSYLGKLENEFKFEDPAVERARYAEKRKQMGVYVLTQEKSVAPVREAAFAQMNQLHNTGITAAIGTKRGASAYDVPRPPEKARLQGGRNDSLTCRSGRLFHNNRTPGQQRSSASGRGDSRPPHASARRWSIAALQATPLAEQYMLGKPSNPVPAGWKCKHCNSEPCRGRCFDCLAVRSCSEKHRGNPKAEPPIPNACIFRNVNRTSSGTCQPSDREEPVDIICLKCGNTGHPPYACTYYAQRQVLVKEIHVHPYQCIIAEGSRLGKPI